MVTDSAGEFPRFLSVREAASLMRVCDDTVRAMVRDGRLTACVVGKRMLRIREADVLALLSGKGVGQ
jgi:excisionase family DNA binding protein